MLQTKAIQTKKTLSTQGRPTSGQAKPTDPNVATVRKGIASGAISPEERHRMIAEAAYFRALERGFDGGDPLTDWLAAEKQIEDTLS
ncbi:MAG: DUF2934 domain-containing protein [Sulfuricaulis sp.]|uniref:DUF2934 domain-containing protein n=1 Tax=Sulfuricaulis sp. TaxID=2003553 RepID=UPI003C649068